MSSVVAEQPPAITMEALELYLRARDAYVAGLSDLERATLRLQKERALAAMIEAKANG